jgi:hypothetical protein
LLRKAAQRPIIRGVRTPGKVSAALTGAVIVAVLALPGSAGALLTLGVTTKSPKDVEDRSVTLSAEATVSVLGASISWQYGTTTSYGSATGSVSTSLVGVNETVSLPVSGLAPDTTYHVRAVAVGGLTTAYGRDVSFKTDKAEKGDDGGTTTTPGTPPGGGTTTTTTPPSTAPSSPTSTTSDDDAPSSHTTKTSGDDKDSGGDGVDTPPSADPAADVPRGEATAAVTPVFGKSLAAAAVQGKVTATSPSGTPVNLSDARAVPSGTVIDTRGGTVELTSALDRDGATQTGRFWGGLFEVRQRATDRGLTQLVLRGASFGACRGTVARAAAKTTKKKKPSRSLWGSDDHGRFQTRGGGSVATVRGTRWLTTDTCDGTRTTVLQGAVSVKSRRTGRTRLVTAGHTLFVKR